MKSNDSMREIGYDYANNYFLLHRITKGLKTEPKRVSPKSLHDRIESGKIQPIWTPDAWVAHKIYTFKKEESMVVEDTYA